MLGFGAALGLTTGSPWPALSRVLAGAMLAALLALPFAVVSTVGRSALAGVGTLIAVIVVTQILTVLGTGAWFPYAAPSLWLGMGGSAVSVSVLQLLLVIPVAAAGMAATAWWWQSAELTSL